MRGRTLRMSLAVLEAAMAAALAVTLIGCSAAKTSDGGEDASAEPIKVGVIVSLTGTYAGLGAPEKKTLELEVERVNNAGGVNGRPIMLLFEDDATDEAKAVAAATKLIDQEKVVALIGATGTGQSMAIRESIDRAGIPQVSMAGGTAITAKFDPLVFQTPWSNTLVVPYTMERLKAAGLTRIGVLTDSGGFGKDGKAVIEAEAPKAGIQIVANETFNPGDTDMTAQLTKIKSSGAQAIVIWNAGKEAAIAVKNAKDLGITIPLYGGHGNARREFITGAGAAAEGFRFAAGKILVPETYGEGTEGFKVATEFTSRYKTFAGESPSTFAGHAYDAFHLITEAAKRVEGEVTPAALREEIENTQGFVGIGGTFNFTDTDHNGLKTDDLVMYEISGGEWKVVK